MRPRITGCRTGFTSDHHVVLEPSFPYRPTQIAVAELLKHDMYDGSGRDVDSIVVAVAEITVKRV
jgi:hypothetical protein